MRWHRIVGLVLLAALLAVAGLVYTRWRGEQRRDRAYLLVARADVTEGDEEQALLLIEALRLSPHDPAIAQRVGWALGSCWRPGEYEAEQAKPDLALQAAEIAGDSQVLWTLATSLLAGAGRADDAERAAQRVRELGPLGADEHEVLASVELMRGDPDVALDHLLAAYEQEGFSPPMWPGVIGIAFRAGRADELLPLVETMRGEAPEAMWLQAWVPALAAVGRYDEAVAAAAGLPAEKPAYSGTVTTAAWAAYELDDLPRMAAFLRSGQATVIVAEANLLRAIYWCDRDDTEMANACLELGLWQLTAGARGGRMAPGVPSPDMLLEDLVGCIAPDSDDLHALLMLGSANWALRRIDAARAAYSRAVELSPGIEPAATFLAGRSLDSYLDRARVDPSRRSGVIMRDSETQWTRDASG